MNNNSWNTRIDKLMLWRANNWIRYESKPSISTLRVHYDQLLIISNTNVLESFNMNSKMKGIYKEDILILIISVTGQEIRKIKFQIKSDVANCLCRLAKHFPVMTHNSLLTNNNMIPKYHTINEVLKHAFESNEPLTSIPIPLDYENFVKLSLLDPTFPVAVLETSKILQDIISENR